MSPEDWVALDRYVAGEGSAEEREAMRQRIQASPNLAAIVEVMRSSRRSPSEAIAQSPSASDAWRSVSARLGLDSPTLRGRSPAPLSLMSSSVRRDTTAGRLAAFAAATLLVVGASFVSWRALRTTSHNHLEAPEIRAEYKTARAERANVELQDGTRIALAPETRLRIASTEREVYLSGEAVFTVTHNPTRPFSVIAANGATIRDLGTRFDVRDYPNEHAVNVVVADGSVSLRGPSRDVGSAPVILSRGTEGVVDSSGAIRITPTAAAEQYLAWADGRLEFSDAPMTAVAIELGRWYDIDLRFGSQKLADDRLTITLSDVPVDVALDAIARALDARVVRAGQSVTLYSRNSRE